MNFLILVLGVVFLTDANASLVAQPLVTVTHDCGYCSNHDFERKTCEILDSGVVLIVDKKLKREEKKSEFMISARKLSAIKDLVRLTQDQKSNGKPITYSGDAPSFRITGYNNSGTPYLIELNSVNSVRIESKEAKRLARLSTRVCNMGFARYLSRLTAVPSLPF